MPTTRRKARKGGAQFVDLLPLVSRELHQRSFPKVRSAGLTNAQFWILKWIHMHGPFTPSELARYLGIRAPSVTPILDGLEGRGYIVRRRSPSDRRVVTIHATAKGKALLRRAGDEVARLAAQATRGVPAADLAAAGRVMRAMALELDSSSDTERTRHNR
jgi:DNA-binding MarR family transcriptional regulator